MPDSVPTALWLPEPQKLDSTYRRRGEHLLDWLSRSTLPLARECRRFLNENLAALPQSSQMTMRTALAKRWHSAFFELIVARLLQELGASIVFEPANAGNKHPDFLAEFKGCNVTVEAIAPSSMPT